MEHPATEFFTDSCVVLLKLIILIAIEYSNTCIACISFQSLSTCTFFLSIFRCSARHIVTVLWPYPFGWLSLLIPLSGVILLFYNVMFLLKAGCIDPGFIPRATAIEGEYFKRLADRDGELLVHNKVMSLDRMGCC